MLVFLVRTARLLCKVCVSLNRRNSTCLPWNPYDDDDEVPFLTTPDSVRYPRRVGFDWFVTTKKQASSPSLIEGERKLRPTENVRRCLPWQNSWLKSTCYADWWMMKPTSLQMKWHTAQGTPPPPLLGKQNNCVKMLCEEEFALGTCLGVAIPKGWPSESCNKLFTVTQIFTGFFAVTPNIYFRKIAIF